MKENTKSTPLTILKPSVRRIVCMGIVILFGFSLISCDVLIFGPPYDPEKDEKAILTTTDYFKVQLYDDGYHKGTAKVYGLTELGKQQEILSIPSYVDEHRVSTLGVNGNNKYKIKSKNLKKIYIPQTVRWGFGVPQPIATDFIICTGEVVALGINTTPLLGYARNGAKIIMPKGVFERSGTRLDEEAFAEIDHQEPNIHYLYNYENSPNGGYHWWDYITGENLYINPENPTREGYEFAGWFLEPECENEWYEILPSSAEETLDLYAFWQKV